MASNDILFVKAQSDNLPNVDLYMVMQFIAANDCYNAAEIRGVKALNSIRKNYVNSAVGYVQLQRRGALCIVKGQIFPEHKIKSKNYHICMEVDETKEDILSVTCQDCAASAAEFKYTIIDKSMIHKCKKCALAFLMWVHEKSSLPASTEVECYWKKPKLSGVGSTLKFVTLKDFGTGKSYNVPGASTFEEEFIAAAQSVNPRPNSQCLKYFEEPDKLRKLSMHRLMFLFVKKQVVYSDFLMYASTVLEDHLCSEGEKATRTQADSELWHELRYGRITASKLYAAAHCKTAEGTLVEQILGASKLKPTRFMIRGQVLESEVLQELQHNLQTSFQRVGLLVTAEHPELGASPDAVGDDCVVEVKCPGSDKSFKSYILQNNQIASKHKAQLQLQMMIFKKNKGFFCVADPNFEQNKKIHVIEEDYDAAYIAGIVARAKKIWKESVYPVLLKSVK